jgi:GNAT superfamily N-acetyltransferase
VAANDQVEVTRTYLELREKPSLGVIDWPPGVTLQRELHCSIALARALYASVGRPYHWYDRDKMSDSDLAAHVAQPNVETWVLRDGARAIGYFELLREESHSTEIVYFGLVQAAHGRGLGRKLLEGAIQAAFSGDTSRVWLHTCTQDHPAALPNYKARGFVPFRSEKYMAQRPL